MSVGSLSGLGELGYPLGQKEFATPLGFRKTFLKQWGLRVPTGAEMVFQLPRCHD